MKQRCYNKNHTFYNDYGGRGIKICDEWIHKESGFINFYNWSIKNNNYKDNLTIDRIDVNGNYEPDNCRWTTIEVQSNNKRNNINLTINGRVMNVTQWAKEYGINRDVIMRRIKNGEEINENILRRARKFLYY